MRDREPPLFCNLFSIDNIGVIGYENSAPLGQLLSLDRKVCPKFCRGAGYFSCAKINALSCSVSMLLRLTFSLLLLNP